MSTIGRPRRLQHKYKFRCEIDGFISAAFKSCSGIEWETEDVELWEGGNIYPYKEPGKVAVPDITLERGIGLGSDMYDWAKQCVDFATHGGGIPEEIKRNVDMLEMHRDNTEARRISCYNCYVKKYKFGEWDAEASEAVIEEIVLRYDYPDDTTGT